eukprot:240563_1
MCYDQYGCARLIVRTLDNANHISIECKDSYSCYYISIFAEYVENINVQCTGSRSCSYGQLYQQNTSSLFSSSTMVNCHGYYSCYKMELSTNTFRTDIICNKDKTENYGCNSMTIYYDQFIQTGVTLLCGNTDSCANNNYYIKNGQLSINVTGNTNANKLYCCESYFAFCNFGEYGCDDENSICANAPVLCPGINSLTNSIIINQDYEYYNKTIQCSNNHDCTVLCRGENSCSYSQIYCPQTHGCFIYCTNRYSCDHVSIDAKYASSLLIISTESNSNQYSTINAPINQNKFTLNCIGSSSCSYSKINAPYSYLDGVNCIGYASCQYIVISAEYSRYINWNCNEQYSCRNAMIFHHEQSKATDFKLNCLGFYSCDDVYAIVSAVNVEIYCEDVTGSCSSSFIYCKSNQLCNITCPISSACESMDIYVVEPLRTLKMIASKTLNTPHITLHCGLLYKYECSLKINNATNLLSCDNTEICSEYTLDYNSTDYIIFDRAYDNFKRNISCNDSKTHCEIHCSGSYSCQFNTIHCPAYKNSICKLHGGSWSLSKTKIFANSINLFQIDSYAASAFSESEFYIASDFANFNCFHDYSCDSIKWLPQTNYTNPQIYMLCNGYRSCHLMNLYIQNVDGLAINCKGVRSCESSNIYSPELMTYDTLSCGTSTSCLSLDTYCSYPSLDRVCTMQFEEFEQLWYCDGDICFYDGITAGLCQNDNKTNAAVCEWLVNTDEGCGINNVFNLCLESCGYCADGNRYCTDVETYAFTPSYGSSLGGTKIFVTSKCFTNTYAQAMWCRFDYNLVEGIPYNANTYICISPARRKKESNIVSFNVKFGISYFSTQNIFTYSDYCSSAASVNNNLNVRFQDYSQFVTKSDAIRTILWNSDKYNSTYIDIKALVWSHELQLYASGLIDVVPNTGSAEIQMPSLGKNEHPNNNLKIRDMIQIKFSVKSHDSDVPTRRRLVTMAELWDQISAIGPIDGWTVKGNKKDAFDTTKELITSGDLDAPLGAHNDDADAFRHCYWSCRMAESIGVGQAKEVGDIHEEHAQSGDNPCLDDLEKKMDYKNNAYGRNVAAEKKNCRSTCLNAAKTNQIQTSISRTTCPTATPTKKPTTTKPTKQPTSKPTTKPSEPDDDEDDSAPQCYSDYGSNCPSVPNNDGSGSGALGDPHYVSLDGKRFDFQGKGVFDLMLVENANFRLQALNEQRGNGHGVTWTTGLAAKQHNLSTIAAHINWKTRTFNIWYNDTLIDVNDESNELMQFDYFSMVYDRQSVTLSFFVGIEATLTAYHGLTIKTSCLLFGETTGLLGTYDDNVLNDFTSRNGTVIPINAKRSQIYYDFGLTWKVSEDEMLFPSSVQQDRRNLMTANVTYVPLYSLNASDIYDASFIAKVERICGASEECFFDVIVTGNLSEANATKSAIKDINDLIDLLHSNVTEPVCYPLCKNDGVCIADGICNCSSSVHYQGERCDERIPGTLTHTPTVYPTHEPTTDPTFNPTFEGCMVAASMNLYILADASCNMTKFQCIKQQMFAIGILEKIKSQDNNIDQLFGYMVYGNGVKEIISLNNDFISTMKQFKEITDCNMLDGEINHPYYALESAVNKFEQVDNNYNNIVLIISGCSPKVETDHMCSLKNRFIEENVHLLVINHNNNNSYKCLVDDIDAHILNMNEYNINNVDNIINDICSWNGVHNDHDVKDTDNTDEPFYLEYLNLIIACAIICVCLLCVLSQWRYIHKLRKWKKKSKYKEIEMNEINEKPTSTIAITDEYN